MSTNEQSFNKLTPAELERLALLAEECGEVLQVIGKILRHGYESQHPDVPDITNRNLLENESGDLLAAFNLLLDNGDLLAHNVEDSKQAKGRRLKKKFYLHHQ